MLESGFRISDLQNIPVYKTDSPRKNKIALDNTFILSYSHTVYGINYNRQNYKIPLNSLRDDLKGYIGVESITAPWTDQLKLWHGNWESTDKNKSYVYEWNERERNDINYSPNKFSDLENSYYIVSDVPFPFETEDLNNRDKGETPSSEIGEGIAYCNNSINTPIKAADPYPDSKKLVTKSYIDERLAGKRLVEVGTDFYVRDYDCTYIIRAEELQKADFDKIIKVHFPESYNKRSIHNKLEFTLLVEGKWDNNSNVWIPAIKEDVNWKVFDFDGKEIEPMWLNVDRPKIIDEYLYSNARYLVFRFETITGDVETVSNTDIPAVSATPIVEETEAGDIVVDYKVVANYDVTILCENLLYRNTGIERINDKEGTYLDIVSKKNTVIPTTTLTGSRITVNLETDVRSSDNSVIITKPSAAKKYWDLSVDIADIQSSDNSVTINRPNENNSFWDLSVDIPDTTDIQSTDNSVIISKPNENKPFWDLSVDIPDTIDIQSTDNSVTINKPNENNSFWDLSVDIPAPIPAPKSRIKKLPEYIDLLEANGNVYWTDTPNPVISLKNVYGIADEVVTFKILYYATEESTIIKSAGHVSWAMTENGESPIFVKDKIYMISFTNFYCHENSPFWDVSSIAKIDYFVPASKMNWIVEDEA